MPSARRLSFASSECVSKSVDSASASLRFCSSGIEKSKLRSPDSTWQTGICSFAAASAAAGASSVCLREARDRGSQHEPREHGVPDDVAPGEAARILEQPVAPLEPEPLDPARCAPPFAGDDVERAPDAHDEGSADRVAV